MKRLLFACSILFAFGGGFGPAQETQDDVRGGINQMRRSHELFWEEMNAEMKAFLKWRHDFELERQRYISRPKWGLLPGNQLYPTWRYNNSHDYYRPRRQAFIYPNPIMREMYQIHSLETLGILFLELKGK